MNPEHRARVDETSDDRGVSVRSDDARSLGGSLREGWKMGVVSIWVSR